MRNKPLLIAIMLLSYGYSPVLAQNHVLAFVKKRKLVNTYTTGNLFAFMDSSKHWQYGILTRVRNDSFTLRLYALVPGSLDTVKYGFAFYALRDVYAMPKAGIQIEEFQGPGNNQVNRGGGHVHFYWIKGGWLFRAMGIGYAGLNVFNTVVLSDHSIYWSGLGYAAGLFLFGEILNWAYKPYIRMNKKYHLSIL